VQRTATLDRTLVMSRGKRFEAARRLSLLPIDKPNTRNEEAPGRSPGVSLHHRYISEAGEKLTYKLLSRNAWETVVL
jgi:hypothetical protein